MRTAARRGFEIGTWVVMAAVLLQFLLAGLGVFTDAGFFFWHATVNSLVVGLLPLLLVLVGWLGGVPGRVLRLGAAIFGLTVVQSLLLAPYHMDAPGIVRAISSLHVLNAVLILWVALQLLERARAWSRGSEEAATPAPGR
jgi:Family of unknown function (DUF6220)